MDASVAKEPIQMRDPLPRRKPFLSALVPVPLCLCVTALVLSIFFRVVDLKPQVSETFFFSKQDPQLRADNQIHPSHVP